MNLKQWFLLFYTSFIYLLWISKAKITSEFAKGLDWRQRDKETETEFEWKSFPIFISTFQQITTVQEKIRLKYYSVFTQANNYSFWVSGKIGIQNENDPREMNYFYSQSY